MKCGNCDTEITFWMGLKQLTPFRFKCSECKAQYKVSTPRMPVIFVVVVVLSAVLCLGLCIGAIELGVVFAIPFLFLMVGIWLMLEAWIHKYISGFGTFTRIGITEQSPAGDP
ncbi:MAG: hypothetical protein KAJ19_27125 [Gammaproteobacteria bacterium]|nr:hypothetical protein [Gammaproteobacteria bacterium]